VLFALFVIATGGAFFVTQRLKRSDPIVSRVFFQPWIGPTCNCEKDRVTLRFDLPKGQRVTVSLVNRDGEVVKTFADDIFLPKGTHPFRWDGRDNDGVVVPDGSYRLRVGLREEGRSVTAPRVLHVDTTPPRPRIVAVTPPTVVPGSNTARGRVRIRFVGPSNPPPEIGVWRTDGGKARQVGGFLGRRGRETATWNGLVNGRPAPEGSYAFSVTVRDRAGNQGSVPRRLPPVKRGAVKRGGVSVAYFTLSGPVVPVSPGGIARFTVGPLPRPVRWRLAPYAHSGDFRTGVSHGRTIAVRIPRDWDSDVYSLRANAGDRFATWPLVVSNRSGSAPVLVVVPTMTWQGQNPVESSRDGWPDTLDAGDDVPLIRGFFRGRPPRSIATETIATLEFLAHIRANYDLTTDVALAAGKQPGIQNHNGVLFAGSERWLTPKVNLQLRRFVSSGGGTVASFGEDAFRRGVDLQAGNLTDPTRPRRTDIYGERTTRFNSPEAPLVLSQDKLNIFAGSDGFIGSFTRFERSDALDQKAALLTAGSRPSAPNDEGKPDFVAYTLGKGVVIRAGTNQWAASLSDSPEVASATRRIWTLLSR
jgi:hypothetical protein